MKHSWWFAVLEWLLVLMVIAGLVVLSWAMWGVPHSQQWWEASAITSGWWLVANAAWNIGRGAFTAWRRQRA